MSRNPSRIVVVHVSRKKSLQQRRQRSKKQHNNEHLQSKGQNLNKSQSNITRQSSLNSTRFSNVSVHHSGLLSNSTKTIINSKQNKIHNEEQNNQIFVRADDENNRSNLSDSIRNFVPTNLNTNDSTAYFDISNTHPSVFNCVRRITPINTQDLFNDDFVIGFNKKNHHQIKNKKRKLSKRCLCKLGLCGLILFLIIASILGALIYVIIRSKNSTNTETITLFPTTTTTQNSVCTASSTICSTPLVFWNNTGVCTQSSPSYRYFSCCYQAISTQLSIEFKLIEQVSVWHIDDVSMTQGNGELINNGGFEMNFTGWTILSSANLSITPLAYYSPSAAHKGSIHLYSTALSTSDKIKQTVNVTQGQYVNISFWWYDEGGVAAPTERCEGSITLL